MQLAAIGCCLEANLNQRILRILSTSLLLWQSASYGIAGAQDYYNTQTDSQPQGSRPTDGSQFRLLQNRANQNQNNNSQIITGQQNTRLRGSVNGGAGLEYPPVQQYGKPQAVPNNGLTNPDSVYYKHPDDRPRRWGTYRPLPLPNGPITGTNSSPGPIRGHVNANPLNPSPPKSDSFPRTPPKKGSASGEHHQAVFLLRIPVPDPNNPMKRAVTHLVQVTYPGRRARVPGDNATNSFNSNWVNVDVVDKTMDPNPVTNIDASYSRFVDMGRGDLIENIYVKRVYTLRHTNGFSYSGNQTAVFKGMAH